MTKDLFIKLFDKLGRDPTDDEMTDAMADLIDRALDEYYEERMSGRAYGMTGYRPNV